MAIGPLDSFVFPGVLTQTKNEAPRVSAQGAVRLPVFIGVADELNPVSAFEMVRGSSSIADNKVTKELIVSGGSYLIDGSNRTFRVTEYPIVSGTGGGVTTNDPTKVAAYVNDESVPVATVVGADGLVTLQTAPASGDKVEISYYFKHTDTLRTNENLSEQAEGTNTTFKVYYVPIVEGNNGGVTTTDPTKVTVKVGTSTSDATAVTVSAVNGTDGIITLAAAPLAGRTVLATYYSNEYQDTYDILPSHNVSSITKVGYNSTTSDFVNGTDFVLDTTNAHYAMINWGHSFHISSGSHTAGSEYFDDSQISGLLFDNHNWRRLADKTANGTLTTFTLEAVPKSGSGFGKTTDDPSKLGVYIGTSPVDATLAGISGQPAVVEMNGASKTITFATAPAYGQSIYVTQYANLLTDDTWTLTDKTTGAVGAGHYGIVGINSGIAMDVQWSGIDTTLASVVKTVIPYPAGEGSAFMDVQVDPTKAIEELVTLRFSDDSGNYSVFSSVLATGTGSMGDNTGHLNQTYIDKKTGFRVTLVTPDTGTFQTNDFIGYSVTPDIITAATSTRAIPGIKTIVANTTGITLGDTAVLTTYNKSGAEPNIGEFYYVTFEDTKDFDEDGLIDPVYVTTEKDALAYAGPLAVNNKLALAAHLSFLNGAPGMILMQIQKTSGESEAPTSRYIKAIDYFNNPMEGGLRPALMEPVTTIPAVLSYVKSSNTIQSSIRYANERMTYFGFPINTTPSAAVAYAQSMNNELMTGIYPDGGIVTLTDELGNNVDYLVDGALLAAAVAGRDTSPAYDVAEPLTRKPVAGFTRLYRRPDTVTQAQIACAGVTILEEQPAGVIVKIDLTTDVSSALTRTPSVIRIKQFVQKGTRNALSPYIGMKFLPSRLNEIETTLKSYLSALVKAGIIVAFQGVKATPDANDPTTVNVEAYYAPTLPLLWIVVTFNLRTRM